MTLLFSLHDNFAFLHKTSLDLSDSWPILLLAIVSPKIIVFLWNIIDQVV